MASTNFPQGVTNANVESVLGQLPVSDPTAVHMYFNDFDTFTAANWTVNATGAATQAITNANNGILALVNSMASADLDAIQLVNTTFAITAGKQAWCKTRFQVTSATNAAIVIGLQPTDTTPLSVTDGVFFSKAAATTTLNLIVEKSSVLTTLPVTTMADNTFVEAGWHYDGSTRVNAYINGSFVGAAAVTNLPTAALTVSMAVSNGTAATQSLLVDYFLVGTER